MQDTPYSTLKENKRNYEIMLLRDREGKHFSEIAALYHISSQGARAVYRKIKLRQLRLYYGHIERVVGQQQKEAFRKELYAAQECYWDIEYLCAWLEKNYTDILADYRAGEPGLPEGFIKKLPSLRKAVRKKTIARIVAMREEEHASYKAIAKALKMTPAKAERTYDMFYHQKVLDILKVLAEERAQNTEEKNQLMNRYFNKYRSSKKCYEALIQDLEYR